MHQSRIDLSLMPNEPTDMALKPANSAHMPEASLLSLAIRDRRTTEAHFPGKPMTGGDTSAVLVSAWKDAHKPEKEGIDTAVMRQRLGPQWDECFWVDHCPERDCFIISPIGRMPEDLHRFLEGPYAMATLVRWINLIATQNRHTFYPVAQSGRLDPGTSFIDVTLTLVPLEAQEGLVTRYLGALGL